MILFPNARRFGWGPGSLNFNGFSNNNNALTALNSLVQFGLSQQSFTVALWLYIPLGYATSDTMTLFNFGTSGSAGSDIGLSTYSPVQVVTYQDGNYTPGPDLAIGWNFVAYTGNGTAGTLYARSPTTIFGTATMTNSTSTGSGSTIVVGNSISLNNAMFVGYMSDVRLYNYPKTQNELMRESLQRQPYSMRGLKSYLPLRNVGSMQNDVFTRYQWTINGTKTNFLNSLQGSQVPEVTAVRRAKFLGSSGPPPTSKLSMMMMGVGS
jgi:hypothetical protein